MNYQKQQVVRFKEINFEVVVLENKRVTLFAGHYGSGKTNIAVNYALHLKEKYEKVVITDLDIVNPYFRTKDSEKELKEYGWRFKKRDDKGKKREETPIIKTNEQKPLVDIFDDE